MNYTSLNINLDFLEPNTNEKNEKKIRKRLNIYHALSSEEVKGRIIKGIVLVDYKSYHKNK